MARPGNGHTPIPRCHLGRCGRAIVTRNEQYLTGLRTFVPAENDNPECIPFYRAWSGMTAVLGKETMDRWHHLLHEAICWSLSKPELEQFQTIIQSCHWIIDRWTRPEEPRHSYSWECTPSEPTEDDARQFFNMEYKNAFPGKRANSKDANALWLEKRERAIAILRERYDANLARHNERERKRDEENARRREEWIDKFWGMALFEQFVRDLEPR